MYITNIISYSILIFPSASNLEKELNAKNLDVTNEPIIQDNCLYSDEGDWMKVALLLDKMLSDGCSYINGCNTGILYC